MNSDLGGNKVEVSYVGYDFEDDGVMDYIEWVVPHLSAQVYEIVLEEASVLLDEGVEIDGENNGFKNYN